MPEQPSHFDGTPNVGEKWEELVNYLKTPLKYSVDTFLVRRDAAESSNAVTSRRDPLGA